MIIASPDQVTDRTNLFCDLERFFWLAVDVEPARSGDCRAYFHRDERFYGVFPLIELSGEKKERKKNAPFVHKF